MSEAAASGPPLRLRAVLASRPAPSNLRQPPGVPLVVRSKTAVALSARAAGGACFEKWTAATAWCRSAAARRLLRPDGSGLHHATPAAAAPGQAWGRHGGGWGGVVCGGGVGAGREDGRRKRCVWQPGSRVQALTTASAQTGAAPEALPNAERPGFAPRPRHFLTIFSLLCDHVLKNVASLEPAGAALPLYEDRCAYPSTIGTVVHSNKRSKVFSHDASCVCNNRMQGSSPRKTPAPEAYALSRVVQRPLQARQQVAADDARGVDRDVEAAHARAHAAHLQVDWMQREVKRGGRSRTCMCACMHACSARPRTPVPMCGWVARQRGRTTSTAAG